MPGSAREFIDVRNGQLVLSGGVLQVDKLVMTNTCSSFIHTGGTLIVGSVVPDPNAFAITSVAREGTRRATWPAWLRTTNALQVSCGGVHGACTTNNFTDLFIVTNNTTAGPSPTTSTSAAPPTFLPATTARVCPLEHENETNHLVDTGGCGLYDPRRRFAGAHRQLHKFHGRVLG